MDELYDHNAAASLVESWGSKLASLEAPVNPDTIAAAKAKVNEITLKEMGPITKAMTPGADNHRQEAILTVVGVLNECELPPVKKHEISEHRLKYARQYAKIIGYDSDTFAKALLNIQDITYKFVTTAPAGQMEPWMPDMVSNDFGKSLVSNCRYFTIGRNIPEAERIPFAQYVDPAGVLGRFIREDVSHCLDNDVAYLELKNDRPVLKDPAGFRIGDIVELGFALVAYRMPQKEGAPRYICKLVMRTLTLLDTSLTKVGKFTVDNDMVANVLKAAYIKRHAQSASTSSKPAKRVITSSNPIAKRRKFYEEVNSDDDDFPDARKRMDDMHISPTRGSDKDEEMH
ncbi:hypothetical protein B0H11DRAFT_1902335 [Mycena galericulata]|nr:hypothetical protein B0H11DRAFT_1902335 [Mycena galericulata]